MKKAVFLFLILVFFGVQGICQTNGDTSDELFTKARQAAFEQKNYPLAIALSKKALELSPDYTDISVFLGRLYTWSDRIDSATIVFESLKIRQVTDEDFYLAYGSLLYWNDRTESAIPILNEGLAHHPSSTNLLLLKAKMNNSIHNYEKAEEALDAILRIDPKHTEARALAKRISDFTAKNALGINYSFTHFDKQFDDPWHLLSLSYKRATAIGSMILKANYANKFADNGMQVEVEAYPRINDLFYLYLGTGFSNADGLFPTYRTGASLYANLPASFEGEIGFRQLHFTGNIWMLTASAGKYYQNFWFNLRTYITPGDHNISHSYTGTMRYYTKGTYDYFAVLAGTGISPEGNRSNLLDQQTFKLKTYKIGTEYHFTIRNTNLFNITVTYFNQEFRVGETGNQVDFSLGYSRIF